MILLNTTHNYNQATPKENKSFWHGETKFRQVTAPISHTILLEQLKFTTTVFQGTFADDSTLPQIFKRGKGIAKSNYLFREGNILDGTYIRCLDVEVRDVELELPFTKENYPYLNLEHTPKQVTLTLLQAIERAKAIAPTFIYQLTTSYDPTKPEFTRVRFTYSFNKRINDKQWLEMTLRGFPETAIVNDATYLKGIALGKRAKEVIKPLFLDIVSFEHKQAMYINNIHPMCIVGEPNSINKANYNLTEPTEPYNLVRHDLVELAKQTAVRSYGSLDKARVNYDLNGSSRPDSTLFYVGGVGEGYKVSYVFDNHEEFAGKNGSYGAEAIDVDEKYLSHTSYLQVSALGTKPSIYDQHKKLLEVFYAQGKQRQVTYTTKYAPFKLSHTHKVQAIISATGSGKNYWAGKVLVASSSKVLVLVPTNAQVSALSYYIRVFSPDKMPAEVAPQDHIYPTLALAIEAKKLDPNDLAIVMTYDKFAWTLINEPEIAKDYVVIIDECHRFFTANEKKFNAQRDSFFRSFKGQNQFGQLVFMSATIEPRFLYDVDPEMLVTEYITSETDTDYSVVSYISNEFILKHVLGNKGKVAMFINNIGVARTLEQMAVHEYGKSVGIIYGANPKSAGEIIDSEPDILFLTSAGREGISINYPVDLYLVFAELNNFDVATFTEIRQAVARTRNPSKVIIHVNPSTIFKSLSNKVADRLIPTQSEAIDIAGAIVSRQSELRTMASKLPNKEKLAMYKSAYSSVTANLRSGLYNTVDEDCIVPEEASTVMSWRISERTILAKRIQAKEEFDSLNIYDLTIMGKPVVVHKVQRKDGKVCYTKLPNTARLQISSRLRGWKWTESFAEVAIVVADELDKSGIAHLGFPTEKDVFAEYPATDMPSARKLCEIWYVFASQNDLPYYNDYGFIPQVGQGIKALDRFIHDTIYIDEEQLSLPKGESVPLLGADVEAPFMSHEDEITRRADFVARSHPKDVADMFNLEGMRDKYIQSPISDEGKLLCMYDDTARKANNAMESICDVIDSMKLDSKVHNISSLPRLINSRTSDKALKIAKLDKKKIDIEFMMFFIRNRLHCIAEYCDPLGFALTPVTYTVAEARVFKYRGKKHSSQIVGYRARDGTEYQVIQIKQGDDRISYPKGAKVIFHRAIYIKNKGNQDERFKNTDFNL